MKLLLAIPQNQRLNSFKNLFTRNLMSKNLLFIAPLPPPIDGQSKASAEALKAFNELGWSINVLNTGRTIVRRSFGTELRRILEVFNFLYKIFSGAKNADVIYLSLSESYLGNIKDLLIYCLIRKNLKNTVIHMLGGSGMDILLNKNKFTSWLNGYFMRQMNAVIVEGERGKSIFKKYFTPDQIKILHNFADEYLHSTTEEVAVRFTDQNQLNILYLSNLLSGKGYVELLDAFRALPLGTRRKMTLTFVGGFQDDAKRQDFLAQINNEVDIKYLGNFIDGTDKKELYLKSHIFCLPTYYPYEGQPISILEAYATGCVVITTAHAGIQDIFKDLINGFFVQKKNSIDIVRALEFSLANRNKLPDISYNNLFEASRLYRSKAYRENVKRIFSKFSN
ncbi:glycosyltransferase family 4 protein [Limnohabitans sp. 2KL-51]|uniref:glycosyltransferase family 4 protein n=1 Tax=Limnohabitans sp. 2KL-51 TaxID=1977911 RepID=UPI001304A862|nr:glycosyltransferase family 4 protein [Limnohabitans sp. 2KL-51]